jgi:FtsH-binding integral membrane protein
MSRAPRTRPQQSRPGKQGGTPAAPQTLLRRLLHQDKNDAWAVKLLPRIVFGIAAAYTLFALASQSGSSFVAVATLIVLGVVVWLLRRRVQLLLALASTIIATALTGYLSAAGDAARWNTSAAVTGQAVFGYWALAGMALLGAWMVKEHPGRRGVTVVLADVILVIASVVGMFLPEAGVPLGFLGVIGVLALRGSSAKAVASRTRRAFGRLRPRKATDPADS